ncbi:MAG: molybdopterin-dependent oxidoreductase [Clostridiales bacterium]|nr:molybdopterin-dependent oxidoreductase [Clostridiales bacterium]
MQICKNLSDWRDHSRNQWEQEYDDLFCGTDFDRVIPLWASVSKEETVLLNQTTLEVIRYYHCWGYKPLWIDGNPPDFLGEQLSFMTYLTTALCHALRSGKESKALEQAREIFSQYYLFDTAKMIWDGLKNIPTYTGYRELLKELVVFLADGFAASENLKKLFGQWLSGGDDGKKELFSDVLAMGSRTKIQTEEPHVIPTGGINNCGGKCVIRPTVAENCMLRIESDCSSNFPQIRACVRGRGYRKTFLNSGRLRFPMKRVGERGSGKFVRISWEEAIDQIAETCKRIRKQYGPEAFFVGYATGVTGIMRPGVLMKRLLALDGGYLEFFNSYSSACCTYVSPYIFGTSMCGHSSSDLLNTKLLILWGDNPAETIFGTERNYYMAQLKEKGIRIICIDPRLNQTAVTYADQWVAPLPTTDSALADAMAYVIWSEGLQDQRFMDTYCLGFDEAHMPEGVPAEECYQNYLFGKKDGIPKTPEWAEKITGVQADVIRDLAREYATAKPACIETGLGPQRHGNGEQTTRSICLLSCLTGNIGIPGGGVGGSSMTKEFTKQELFNNKVKNPYPGQIPVFLWSKAIEHGTEMTPVGDRLKGVDHLNCNIKILFNLAGNTLVNQHSDINDTIRILKDDSLCELIVTSELFMTASARYSDLILPATSMFENENITGPWRGTNYLLKNNQVIRPLFETRVEWEWQKELAKKLGIYEEFTDGMPEQSQWLEENYRILREKEPDLPEYSVFCKEGGWQHRNQKCMIAFENEIREPEKYPFATPSGKIEIFSKRLYDFHQEDIPAIPCYLPCPEGPEDCLKERYPLQLIGWHTRRRCHSIHDNNEWQDEVEAPGLWISREDAVERGIRNGDQVRIWNDRGEVDIPAIVTSRIRPGVVAMSQGGWYTPDEKGRDVRGSINVLTSTEHPSPLAKGNPQHTNLVQVELICNFGGNCFGFHK